MCFRYKRKGSSSLGLDPRRQQVSWEESESKKQKSGDKKKAADRYFSTVSRQLLRSEPPVSTLPTIPESSDIIKSTSFLPLDGVEEKKGVEAGKRFCHFEAGYTQQYCCGHLQISDTHKFLLSSDLKHLLLQIRCQTA